MIVTVWRDWASLTAALGDDPTRPYLLTLESGLVDEVTVEHFEALDLPGRSAAATERPRQQHRLRPPWGDPQDDHRVIGRGIGGELQDLVGVHPSIMDRSPSRGHRPMGP